MSSRFICASILALGLSGCDAIRSIAPQTVAGFETNGIIGAIDGASGAVLVKCLSLDGEVVRVAMDGLALETGQEALVDRVRSARQRACRIANLASTLSAGGDAAMTVDGAATAN